MYNIQLNVFSDNYQRVCNGGSWPKY